jgi:hypothetical protein
MTTTTDTNTSDLLQQALAKLATADPNAVAKSCQKLCGAFKAKSPWTPNLEQMELFWGFVEQQVASVKVPKGQEEISTESHQALRRAYAVAQIIMEAQGVFLQNGQGFDFGKTWQPRLEKLQNQLIPLEQSIPAGHLRGALVTCQSQLRMLTDAHRTKVAYLAGLLEPVRQ